jgi:hypothetical protein
MRKVLFVILVLLIVVGGVLYLRIQSLPAIIKKELILRGVNNRYFSRSFHFEQSLGMAPIKQIIVYSGFISVDKQISQEASQEIIRMLNTPSNYEGVFTEAAVTSLTSRYKTLIF